MRSRPAAFVSTFTLIALAGCGGAAPPIPPAAPALRAAVAVGAVPPQSDNGLGRLDFPVTGSAECQRHFTEGMLALHSFLYDQAHVSFGAALASDPKCAMAAWGDAMAYDEAIWDNRDVAKGRAALAHVGGEEALTPKERAYLRVARADYEKDLTKDAHVAWLAAASAMHRDYPDDDEVTLQYALALLSNYIEDDGHVREQMEAGSLVLQVLQRNPQHPGAAHYVIHAFDSPDHAILALPAARVYARIAPAGSHALHMPSHVFTQLGMWSDVVRSNEQAYAASVAWEKSRGHTPSDYDWHSYSWLVAAHLELGQRAAAKKLTEEAGALPSSSSKGRRKLDARNGSKLRSLVMYPFDTFITAETTREITVPGRGTNHSPPMPVEVWLIFAAALLLPAVIVVLVVRGESRKMHAREELLRSGVRAHAHILSVTPGVRAGRSEVECVFEVRATTDDGDTFLLKFTTFVPHLYLSRVQPGFELTIRFDPKDRERVVIEAYLTPQLEAYR